MRTSQDLVGRQSVSKCFSMLGVILLYICLSPLPSSLAILVNTTIDDTNGDPDTGVNFAYSPAASWSEGPSCQDCPAHPDPDSTYDRTWHDGSYNTTFGPTPKSIISASVSFTGVAVYVYCIIAHTSFLPDGNTDMTFLIDGAVVGEYSLAPTNVSEYTYNFPVCVNTSLPNLPHTFSLESGHAGQKALVLLDYLVYTHDDSKSTSKTTIIIAAAVSSLALVFILFAAFLCTRRHIHRKIGKPHPLDLDSQFSPRSSALIDNPWMAVRAFKSPPRGSLELESSQMMLLSGRESPSTKPKKPRKPQSNQPSYPPAYAAELSDTDDNAVDC